MDPDQVISALKERLSPNSQVALPHDSANGVGRKRWTTWKSPCWMATVKPDHVQDVQSIVKFCGDNNIPFHAVATGHHYTTGYEKVKDVLQIDISNLNSVEVDAAENTITTGGAARFRDIFDPLYQAGKEMPVGGCSSAGVVGVALGGGLNRWGGLYGLIADSLLEVDLVTATGDMIKVSKTENPELFWGLRGAGFNFGIVVRAKFRVYDQTNEGKIAIADMILPYEKAMDCVKVLKGLEGNRQPALSVALGAMWNDQAGGPCILISCLYMGPRAEGEPYFKQFLDLGPVMQAEMDVPFNELYLKWVFGGDASWSTYEELKTFYSAHVKELDLPTYEWYFAELAKLFEQYPACRGSAMLIEDWATKTIAEIPDEETAYPHRDVSSQTIFVYSTTDPSLQDMLDESARRARERFVATNGFDEPKVYVSYAHGDESQEALYGSRKLDRLRALKRKWDPKQQFSFNAPILI